MFCVCLLCCLLSHCQYLWICLLSCAATFFLWSELQQRWGVTEDDAWLLWSDTLGVAAFSVIGAMNGVRAGVPLVAVALCGMMTATFGGVVRDVLCRRPPRILHSHAELYASTALAGASVYALTWAAQQRLPALAAAGPALRIAAGFATAFAARTAAVEWGLRLPTAPWVNAPKAAPPAPTNTPAATGQRA